MRTCIAIAALVVLSVALVSRADVKPVQSSSGKFEAKMAGNDIVIIDLATKKEMRRFRDHKADVTVMMFGPQGDVLYSADADGVVVVVNVVTGKQRFKVDAGKKIVAMKLEPKENRIVVTMSDKTKKMLNSTTGKVMP